MVRPDLHRSTMAATGLAAVLLLAGCGADGGSPESSPATARSSSGPMSPSVSPPATSTPTGTLTADLRQSTHDRLRGEMEVWIANGTDSDVTPSRIVYRDPRFPAPMPADRLRTIPAGSERGFSLALPRAVCPPQGRAAPLEVTYGGTTVRVPVDDSIEVVERHVGRECLLRTVSRIARIRFADRVEVDRTGTGHLVLLVEPADRTDAELVIEQVNGTYLLGHPRRPFWSPGVRVHGSGDPVRIRLPVEPARCDPHAFQEGGGATTFVVRLSVGGRSGQVTMPMSNAGMAAALDWAAEVCHLGEPDAGQD